MSRFWRQITERVEYLFWQWLRSLGRSNTTETPPPDWLEPTVIWVARGLALFFAVALVYVGWRFLWPLLQRWQSRDLRSVQTKQTAIARPQSVTYWLEQARQLQAQEDYSGACRALYMALLIRLEEGGWLNQDQARTDREYLQRLEALWTHGQRPTHLRKAFYQIFQTHEQLCYGQRAVASQTFQNCQDAYFELEPELKQSSS